MRNIKTIVFLLCVMAGCQDDDLVLTTTEPITPPAEDPRPATLVAPALHVGIAIETGDCSLSWSSSPYAAFYTVQEDIAPSFLGALVVYQGASCSYDLRPLSPAPVRTYYRVRAENDQARSPWSNAVVFPR